MLYSPRRSSRRDDAQAAPSSASSDIRVAGAVPGNATTERRPEAVTGPAQEARQRHRDMADSATNATAGLDEMPRQDGE